MTQASIQQHAVTHSAVSDRYLIVLAFLLVGYAILGKTFAYIGVPPLYIGEMVFALGAIAFLSTRCAIASFATLPNLLLAIPMGWVIIRTLPYIGEYGFNALRDSMIVVYGGFAFIVTALLLEKPERLLLVVRFFRILALIIVPLAPILVVFSTIGSHSDQEVLAQPKIGTTAVHLAAAALLAFLGFKRASPIWLILLLMGMIVATTQSRGAMVVMIFMLSFAAIASGRLRQFSIALGIGVALIGTLYIFDVSIPTIRQERDISAEQLVENVGSVFGAAGNKDLSGTKEWRLHWWDEIIDYTLNGPYFWSGKGFGIDLGEADGIIHASPTAGSTPTRSPHSAHLTILARSGVPGLVLWLLTLACWSTVVLMNMVRARLRRDKAWADFFLLIFCYATGFLVDAAFDVTLEGPMAGIWFWCVFGVGTGASMIYRAGSGRIGLPHNRLTAPLATASV